MRAVVRKIYCYHESGEAMETYGVKIYDDHDRLTGIREFDTEEEVIRFCDNAEFDEVDW